MQTPSTNRNCSSLVQATGNRTRSAIMAAAILVTGAGFGQAQDLEAALKRMPVAELVKLVQAEGDAARGAVAFFQPSMACSKCHSPGSEKPATLGPRLDQADPRLTDEGIIESVLEPSKSIRQGFESVTVVTNAGQSLTGLVVEKTPDFVTLRDGYGTIITTATADIDELAVQPLSLMPAGQVNQLSSRQQFLDLVRYLYEIRDGGPVRARQLQPSEALLTLKLPEYETHIDHAGFINSWDEEAVRRGEAIYRRVCANCHGTKDQPGSLPTSLKFASGKFKNGSDPLSMYRTLTRGFGFMAAQSWMVPSQKYDVIHYIREHYLKTHNPTQYVEVTNEYLASLPPGDTRGPEPSVIEPWSNMDYGSWLTHCYEVPGETLNFAYKGIAIRLDEGAGGVSRGEQWMLFDTDTLRVAAGWSRDVDEAKEQFIDWRGIQFDGEHGVHPHTVGDTIFANSIGPGWAEPESESFDDDDRVVGRDGRRYGPLPREWAKFRGLYAHGTKVVLSYSVGDASVLEMPGRVSLSAETSGQIAAPVFVRTFNIGPRSHDLVLQLAELGDDRIVGRDARGTLGSIVTTATMTVGVLPGSSDPAWSDESDRLTLRIPSGQEPLQFSTWQSTDDVDNEAKSRITAELSSRNFDLASLTQGGPARWNQILETPIAPGASDDNTALIADVLTTPDVNPWLAQIRCTGIDFFRDGSLAVCTWDGDVWRVELDEPQQRLRWQRVASGLYQPLGIRVIEDVVHVGCRDQIAVLRDLNGDRETDFYECLNNDHQVTEHFHEFAMGLQTDADGNFYYAKSARHALKAVVPHHGTLLRVPPDGSKTEIIANGFRAANGVCLNSDGSFFVTDQEGHWNPKNRINWVTLRADGRPNFYGNMFGYHDVTDSSDSAMVPPLCWITNQFDRSPGELMWVNSDKWGSLNGGLLNLSYGTGKVFAVLQEEVEGVRQGGMIELPVPAFPTGVMRGRFNPADQQLYLCGMFAWAGNATQPGGLYRIRATGMPSHVPTALHASKQGLVLSFPEPLRADSVMADAVTVRTWSLKRTKDYGSDHHDERTLAIRKTMLSDDGRTVTIDCDSLSPVWCMEIRYEFRSIAGQPVSGVIHNTIHHLR